MPDVTQPTSEPPKESDFLGDPEEYQCEVFRCNRERAHLVTLDPDEWPEDPQSVWMCELHTAEFAGTEGTVTQPTSEPETVRQWTHRKGDRYVHIVANAWMNESGYGITHVLHRWEFPTAARAWNDGLRTLDRSDDFNTGVIRDDKLVAILWRYQIVDDDPEVIAEIADEIGLEHA